MSRIKFLTFCVIFNIFIINLISPKPTIEAKPQEIPAIAHEKLIMDVGQQGQEIFCFSKPERKPQ